MEIRKNIFISFSGGRTSAYMCKYMLDNHGDKNLLFLFANTGQEHPKTYEFIKNVVDHLGVDLKIVEAKIGHEKGTGTTYSEVTFDDMHKGGRLFEESVQRFGVFNMGYPACTRELKLQPMKKFANDYFKGEKYTTVIGIRSDEIDRVNSKYEELDFYYPLAFDHPISKAQVNDFWKKQPFDLEIPDYLGNCVWCWKKTAKKHQAIIRDYPEAFDVPKFLEKKYRVNNIESQARFGETQTFFRGHLSALDLFDENKIKKAMTFDFINNYENSCEESCVPDFSEHDGESPV